VGKEILLMIVLGVGLVVYLVTQVIEAHQRLQKFRKHQLESEDD
jgi:hypothetical protein